MDLAEAYSRWLGRQLDSAAGSHVGAALMEPVLQVPTFVHPALPSNVTLTEAVVSKPSYAARKWTHQHCRDAVQVHETSQIG